MVVRGKRMPWREIQLVLDWLKLREHATDGGGGRADGGGGSDADIERFLEHSYTPPIDAKDAEKKLEEAMKETDERLRQQAIVGAVLAIIGTAALAFPPAMVAAGVAGLVAKVGIAASAAMLSVGGTAVLADAMNRLGNGG